MGRGLAIFSVSAYHIFLGNATIFSLFSGIFPGFSPFWAEKCRPESPGGIEPKRRQFFIVNGHSVRKRFKLSGQKKSTHTGVASSLDGLPLAAGPRVVHKDQIVDVFNGKHFKKSHVSSPFPLG
ncbi:MAG: hypothetical protein RR288_03980 [Oscillibacter sp.]